MPQDNLLKVLKFARLACAAVFIGMTGIGLADAASAPVVAWTLVGSGAGYVFAALISWRLRLLGPHAK